MRILFQLLITIYIVLTFQTVVFAQKRIVISYDDVPYGDRALYSGDERTTRFIQILNEVNSGPVLFFVTTRGIEKTATGDKRLHALSNAGHILANHSHSHMWAHKTSAEDYLADIDLAEKHLSEFDNTRAWFRFPFLDEGRKPEHIAALAKGLEQCGLSNGYVIIDTYDWHMETRLQEALEKGYAIDYKVYVVRNLGTI